MTESLEFRVKNLEIEAVRAAQKIEAIKENRTSALTERVLHLEASAWRTKHQLDHLTDQSESRASALEDLSAGLRELRHDVSEIKATLKDHGKKLNDHGEKLDQILELLQASGFSSSAAKAP